MGVMLFIRESFHFQTAKANFGQEKQQINLLEEYYVAVTIGERP